MRIRDCFALALCLGWIGAGVARAADVAEPRLELQEGWHLQSSAHVTEDGSKLSEAGFAPAGWYDTTVPTTVMAALVEDKVYPDPDFGTNLRSIPGVAYRPGQNFSNIEMPDDSPFKPSWWYQTSFTIPADYAGKQIWLHFDGINYRANIWLNGKKIASTDQVVGMWRMFEFNVTADARAGQANALAVEVFPPHADDLANTWVDWNPMPPDKNMGLWRPVYLTATGPVELRHPQVLTHLDLPSLEMAHLTVSADLRNATRAPVTGNLKGRIGAIEFEQRVEIPAGETRTVTFAPEKFSNLNLRHPRLWWPWQMGAQNLYDLKLEFDTGGKVSDRAGVTFGVREVTSELNSHGYRQFHINGKNILILGGGWAPDMMLRVMPEKMEAEIRYARNMNLNTLRLEGKLDTDHFFDLCDRYGILVLAGWCCCDHWEKWKTWKPEDYTVSAESLRDQVERLRNHPCVFGWLYGSDNPPPPRVEEEYLKVLKECHWPNPSLSSATAKPTTVTGASGVKMTGPYEWVPPDYWLLDKNHGGAYGFNTETSPGPAVPPLASLKRMLPADHLWPIDDVWNYHAGGGEFSTLKVFTAALNARYGEATNVEDYAEKSQLMTYEGERAMFEAYRRNKYVSTGVVQWMFNNAWPSMIWHLFDYYLRPGGGFFGTQKACEPLHVQYSYDDHSVVVTNSLQESFMKMKVEAKILDIDLNEKFSKEETLDVAPDSSTRAFTLPDIAGLSKTYFVRLTLSDAAGQRKSSNFYWLSTQPDVLDWEKSQWYVTPVKTYADLSLLKSLPEVRLELQAATKTADEQSVTQVTLKNPSSHLAFFVHLAVTQGAGGDEVLPVLWQDNYFELMPGEERQIAATYAAKDLHGQAPAISVDGWNVPSSSVPAGNR